MSFLTTPRPMAPQPPEMMIWRPASASSRKHMALSSAPSTRLLFPLPEDLAHLVLHFLPSEHPVVKPGQQEVVIGLGVTDMGDDSETDRLAVELLRRRGSAHAPAVFQAGVLRDPFLHAGGTTGKLLTDRLGESLHKLPVHILTTQRLSHPPPLPQLPVRQR